MSTLTGIRVVELAQGLAGPAAGLALAEMGADVVKIERPEGDPGRTLPVFAVVNRSKRSVTLDIDTQSGLDRLKALLAEADVFLHDVAPTRAKKLGLDDAALGRHNPQLISCSVLGFPVGHADADRPNDELLVAARSGVLDEQDGHREGPIVYRYPMGAWGAAQLAASGILTRLIMRKRTGKGGGVHTSLLQGMLAPFALVWSRVESAKFFAGAMRPAPGTLQFSLLRCSDDRWLQIMDPQGKLDYAALPLMWEVMAELDLDINDLEQRRKAFAARPSEAWLKDLRAADVAVECATTLGEVLTHPEAEANHYVVDIDDPVWGHVRQPAIPLRLSDKLVVKGPAPKAGAHNAQPWSAARQTQPFPQKTNAGRPLDGVKVVDFGAFLAGPMAPSLLGDLGADIVKVEPTTGDRMRFMTRYFHAASRNKRSLAVDLTKPKGQEILARLARWADVVHHNIRIRAAEKLGLDETSLRRINPKVVFSYVSAYGLEGERANWPGYDSIFEAVAGWEIENAGTGNNPVFMRAGAMDVLCALTSAVGTLAAFYRGQGSSAETSLFGISCMTQGETMVLADGSVASYERLNGSQTGTSALHRIYQTSDGWIAVAANEKQRNALCSVLAVAKSEELEAAARARSSDELLVKLAERGIAAELVTRGAQDCVFDNEANKASKVVVGYHHQEFGQIEQPGAYLGFSDAELRLDPPLAPPILGEHTNDILAEIGYDQAEIAELYKSGIVAGPNAP